ncbi:MULTISPECIES: DUF3956 family protein [unclassified Bacillus (in: firmicutes)]|nr:MULTISPECIES: DUF3956 family protein [unclassified Bacillus (in: firmicutes)]SFI27447.1 Protein of unknown function [Bacillus sp. 71mf]SFS39942.1 Protein of unknown function [Bacillus sp. 103mf]
MVVTCIAQVTDQFFLVTEFDGVEIRIHISAQLAAILKALGVPSCE